MDALSFLTYIAVILLLGVIVSSIASHLRIPDILFLIITGMVLGAINYKGETLIHFPVSFLTSIGIVALALIVFDSTSKIKIRQFDTNSLMALKLAFIAYFVCAIGVGIFAHFLFGLPWMLSFLLSTIISGTAPEVILALLENASSKPLLILKFESLINTPLTVLFPFIVLDLITTLQGAEGTLIASTFLEQIVPFLTKFVAGIGAGIFVGIILFKVLQKKHSKLYSPLAVLLAALLAYVLAENLHGNGVLAVTTLGLFFGNIQLKEKEEMLGFETIISKALYILVFVLIGVSIQIPFTQWFFIKTGILFVIYLIFRYIAVSISYKKDVFTFWEKIFMTCISSKGIAVAVVTFALAISSLTGVGEILDITLVIMLYSIIFSSMTCWIACRVLPTKNNHKNNHKAKK